MSENDEDAELEGEDEMSVGDHFAPVWRSLKRTVTSRSIQAYAISFVGIVVLSASIGPVVVGSYATVQKDFGLCGKPSLEVSSPADTAELTAEEKQPTLPRLDYGELSPATRRAFRGALDAVNNERKVEGPIDHEAMLEESGVIVTYRGTEHHTVLHPDNCVPSGAYPLAISILGLLVGVGIVAVPRVSKRFRGES